jgi:hypothetical protein
LDKLQIQKTSFTLLCFLQAGVMEAMGKQELSIGVKQFFVFSLSSRINSPQVAKEICNDLMIYDKNHTEKQGHSPIFLGRNYWSICCIDKSLGETNDSI